MKKIRFFVALLTGMAFSVSFTGAIPKSTSVYGVTINTGEKVSTISPYIYGVNDGYKYGDANVTFSRLGGNRMTGYNWENNYSNAGSDWNNESDQYVVSNLPYEERLIPGRAVTAYQDKALANNIDYSLVTLQMAGYVAKDDKKAVSEAEVAPSNRWDKVEFKKGAPFTLNPDTNDGVVYMDEEVNFLVNKYGDSTTSTGIKGYSLDNEPALWSETHSRIHPSKVTCKELVERSVGLASAIKDVDANAEVFGPALYGFSAYTGLQDASDWNEVKGNYKWFIEYYLDQMKKAESESGKRLVDVLDIHYYSEAQGDCRVTSCTNASHTKCQEARVQATRTLFDSSYTENSWIGQWCKSYLPLIPTIQKSIDTYYPNTKLAITEYNFGGENLISGGIAEADALGIFGQNNVYAASLWQLGTDTSYSASALKLYTNYDNKNSKYGDTALDVDNNNIDKVSVYSSVDSKDDSKLHVILINKDLNNYSTVNLSLNGANLYSKGEVYGFDSSSANVVKKGDVAVNGNTLNYTLPKGAVYHVVLDKEGTNVADINGDGKVDNSDLEELSKFYNEKTSDEKYDLNKDGIVDVYDMVIVGKAIEEKKAEEDKKEEEPVLETTWKKENIYNNGDTVIYNGEKYRAKWWTQGEIPGTSSVWEKIN